MPSVAGSTPVTLRLLVMLARLLLVPVVLAASLAGARVLPVSALLLLVLAYAACLLGFAAWPRRSLRRVGVPMTGWLAMCWAMGLPRGGTGIELGAILAGCLACALPRAVRDYQRRARGHERMGLTELRAARRHAGRPSRWQGRAPTFPAPRDRD